MKRTFIVSVAILSAGVRVDGKSGATKKKKYKPEIQKGYDQPEHECEYTPFEFGQPLVKANSTKVFGKRNAVVLFSSSSCTSCCPLEHAARDISANIAKGVKFFRVDSDSDPIARRARSPRVSETYQG